MNYRYFEFMNLAWDLVFLIPMIVPVKDSNQREIEHHNSGDDFLLELIYPNGIRLRIKSDPDLDHLRSLVCLLG